jgi:hypothetical protein
MSSVAGEPIIGGVDVIRLVYRAWIRPVFFVRRAIHVFRAWPTRCQKEETRVVRTRQAAAAGIAPLSGHANYRSSSVACVGHGLQFVFPVRTRIFSVADEARIDAFSCVERGCKSRGGRHDSYFERGLRALTSHSRILSEVLQCSVAKNIVSRAMDGSMNEHLMRFRHHTGPFFGLKPARAIVFRALGGGVARAWITVFPAIQARCPSAARLVCRAREGRIPSAQGCRKTVFFQILKTLFQLSNQSLIVL